MLARLPESLEEAKSNLEFSLVGIRAGLGCRLPWASDSLLIPNKTMGWAPAWRREGLLLLLCLLFLLLLLQLSFSKILLESCRRGSHLQGWVGGQDGIGWYRGWRKIPRKPIFQQIIFLMVSLQFIGEGPRVSLSREPGKNFPRSGREIVGGIF